MQQRSQFYTLEQILSADLLGAQVYALQGDANALQSILGSTASFISNLVVSPTSPTASLTLNISNGFMGALAVTDASSYGSLAANTQQVMQLGFNLVTTVAIDNSGLSSGQAQYVLIESGFEQIDSDPVVLPYVNISNPPVPLNGPGNSGIAQDTVRNAVANIVVKYGTPATAGSEVPPTPDAGYVVVAYIDLTHGQTQITGGEILFPNNVVGAPQSPVLAGLLNSHHGGVLGQAPKILLGSGAEVQGELPIANMVASNTIGAVSSFRLSTVGNPNSYYSGNANTNNACDSIYDPTNNVLYFCTTTGDATHAVWTSINGLIGANFKLNVFTTSGTYTPSVGAKYAYITAVGGGGGGGSGVAELGGGGGMGGAGAGTAMGLTLISAITTPVTVTVGAGGVGAVGGGNTGGTGGNTTFGTYVTGGGGTGGVANAYGGTPGVGTSTLPMSFGFGGQGGNSSYNEGGGGGSSFLGGGGAANVGEIPVGSLYGGGGSGSPAEDGEVGAAGGNGICIVLEYIGA